MPLLLLWHPRAVQQHTDTATVYVDIQVSSADSHVLLDDAEVYINITVGTGVPQYVEIVGVTSRWAIEAPLAVRQNPTTADARWRVVDTFSRWQPVADPDTRWKIVVDILRWAIMETRRFFWRG